MLFRIFIRGIRWLHDGRLFFAGKEGSSVPFRRIGEKRNKRDLTRLLGCEKHLQSAIISYRQTKRRNPRSSRDWSKSPARIGSPTATSCIFVSRRDESSAFAGRSASGNCRNYWERRT